MNPVTSAKEVATATPEKDTSTPKCPTIISDTTSIRYCETVTATIGAAIELILFNSSQNATSSSSSPLFLTSAASISLQFSMLWRINVECWWQREIDIYIGPKSASSFLIDQTCFATTIHATSTKTIRQKQLFTCP